jgi:hypothetical protein
VVVVVVVVDCGTVSGFSPFPTPNPKPSQCCQKQMTFLFFIKIKAL